MNIYKKWNAAVVSIGVIILWSGFLSGIAADKKEIPDHTSFQSCQGCHAEKNNMWVASGHGKAISQNVRRGPAGKDCSGCHSSKGPEAGQQGARSAGAEQES